MDGWMDGRVGWEEGFDSLGPRGPTEPIFHLFLFFSFRRTLPYLVSGSGAAASHSVPRAVRLNGGPRLSTSPEAPTLPPRTPPSEGVSISLAPCCQPPSRQSTISSMAVVDFL